MKEMYHPQKESQANQHLFDFPRVKQHIYFNSTPNTDGAFFCVKKQSIKASDNSQETASPKTKKTLKNENKILEYLKDHGRSKCAEIAGYLELSVARTRAIIANMPEVEIMGSNRNRTYRIK